MPLRPAVAAVTLLAAYVAPAAANPALVKAARKDFDESTVAFHAGIQLRLTNRGVVLASGCGVEIDRLRPEEITPERHRALRVAATAADAGFDGELLKSALGGYGSVVVERNAVATGSADLTSFSFPPVENEVIEMPFAPQANG